MNAERLSDGLKNIRTRVFNKMWAASKNNDKELAEWLESLLVEIDATLAPQRKAAE